MILIVPRAYNSYCVILILLSWIQYTGFTSILVQITLLAFIFLYTSHLDLLHGLFAYTYV